MTDTFHFILAKECWRSYFYLAMRQRPWVIIMLSRFFKSCWRSNTLRLIFILIVTTFISIGCGGSGDNINTPDAVTLNAEGNIAEITQYNKSYTIDVSSNNNATIDQSSISMLDVSEVVQTNRPAYYTFPDGLLSFTIKNLSPAGGDTVTVVLTFPTTYSSDARYFKVTDAGFEEFGNAVFNDSQVTLTLTDNGNGDSDSILGQITDPGGPAVPDDDDGDGDGVTDDQDDCPNSPILDVVGEDGCSVLRFTDMGNGTVRDNVTGLIWLKNANCFGYTDWWAAAREVRRLCDEDSDDCGLFDGSTVGDWRLPTKGELQGIGTDPPTTWYSAVPSVTWNTPGTPFQMVAPLAYWSCNEADSSGNYAWVVDMANGNTHGYVSTASLGVWPVRSDN